MNAAFLNEWQLYRRGAQLPPIVGLEPKTDSEFDADVTVGEIRIFADTNRPLVALVVEDRRLSGWRIVPASPFCAPASARELMVGERVFQLWNATVVSRRFASRSWRVDTISDSDLAEIRGAIAAANPGRVTAGDGVQAKYEREFLVGEGTLVPFAESRAADLPRFAWMPVALKIAASLALCLAAWYVLMMDSGRQIVRNWRESFHAVDIVQEDAAIELADAHEVREVPVEIAEVDIDFTPPSVTWHGPAPEVVRPAKFADVKGPKVPEEIAKFRLKGEGYKSPLASPMEVVFLSGGERKSHAPAQGGEFRYAAAIAPLDAPPKVACTLRNGEAAVELEIQCELADGAKITVMFDSDIVEGYKSSDVISDGKRMTAKYALMVFPGKTISPESVFVTLIWPSKDGDERTPVSVGQ
ncbi:MAG: hypothetical protein IKU71_00175 [Kiritimatiellae bacterium]|nr:hypothetical protein [Kiritimatiellia bacterium]